VGCSTTNRLGLKADNRWVVFRLPCMSYYLPVMPLPYVFRTHPVLNMTSSSSRSLGCENWHCIYNATTNSDSLQSSIAGKVNNSNNLASSPRHLGTACRPKWLIHPSRHPTSLCVPDRRQQVPNNTAYTSSSPGAYQHGASNTVGAPHARDLGPWRGRKSTTEGGPRQTSEHSRVCVSARPRLASTSELHAGNPQARASCGSASTAGGTRRARGRELR
jgi:hypothetical protein